MPWKRLLLTLSGLLFISAVPARAQLLFAGGEDVDFVCSTGGSCQTDTNGSSHRASWSRESYEVYGTTNDPPTNRIATATFSASSTIWVHGQFCEDYNNSCQNGSSSSAQMIRVFDSNGNVAIAVVGTSTAGQVAITSRSTSGVFTTLVTCPSAIGTALEQLDLYINYGSAGAVTLYQNSASVCNFSGNVTNGDGSTTLNKVEFSSPSSSNYGAWSEIIVGTSDTRAMARFTANTSANGNATGFSGTNICSAIWNANAYNDSNYGYTGSNSVLHECTVNNAIPAGSYTVVGLVMSARALVGSSGPQHFDFLTRTGGADYASSDFSPLNSFSNIRNYIQTVNPATGNAWAVSDLTATGFNVGEESKP